MPNREDEIITRSAPRWAWEIIDETLATDARSIAFDPDLRADVQEAVDAMTQASEEPDLDAMPRRDAASTTHTDGRARLPDGSTSEWDERLRTVGATREAE